MSTIRVHTTQNVTLEYEAASVGDRIVAALLDYLLLIAWGVLWALLLSYFADGYSGVSRHLSYSDPAGVLGLLLLAIICLPFLFYFLLAEIFFNGQTLGKKARHMRVMRLDGTPAGLGDYLLRWLLRPIEIIATVGSVAAISVLVNGKGQRLGDLLAGTTVLSLRPAHATQLLAREAAIPDGYQPVFPQAAQLSDHDAALLRQLLSRGIKQGNYLLLNETALKVKALLGIHTDLSDEPFLRTILRDQAYLLAQG
ncbi:RDD family protein [Hymenobacter baengnokdamensis]|uniref:RDD family protein n=1 Tax=Hymenobacter baengnokdamensis TaxID=2615203 RepID=UPI00124458A0|nr:RDD family protein [Hymenobacter baengnokdamensis]